MVRIPFIKIQGVRVGSIDPTLDIGTGGAIHTSPEPSPEPVFLTNWKIVGSSEVKTLPYPDGIVLPNGYKRCEYLQSDGTAYIEVPFGFNKTDEVYLKGAFTDSSYKDKYMVSPKVWNDDTNRFGLGTISQNREGTLIGYISCSIGSTPNVLQPLIEVSLDVFEFEYKDYICRVGNSSANYTNATFGSTTQNLRLFYGHNATTKCKIYEYRHKKGNTEYRLIPCLDSNDTPCMYDVINNQAYYNSAGSGSFTYKLYPQPTEIWSCGEYNPIDGKYHILVQPLGGSVADIALDEPLRKVDDIADTIEFPSDIEGKALVTRCLNSVELNDLPWNNFEFNQVNMKVTFSLGSKIKKGSNDVPFNGLCPLYTIVSRNTQADNPPTDKTMFVTVAGNILIYDLDYDTISSWKEFLAHIDGVELIYELNTPTTELVDAPQIAEAESYSMVISQGGKAVEWSSFITNSE